MRPALRLTPKEHELYQELRGRGVWVVTTEDAINIASVSREHSWKLLHSLHRKGALLRVGKGVYAVAPPEALNQQRVPLVDAFRVLDQLMKAFRIRRYYVAYASAAYLHGAAHEIPFNISVATLSSRRPVQVGDARITFHRIPRGRMFGVDQVRHFDQPLFVSNAEKTLLDCADRLDLCGGVEGLAQAAWELGAKADGGKLAALAEGFRQPAAVRRLAFVLARLAKQDHRRVSPDLAHALRPLLGAGVTPLDPSQPNRGRVDPEWGVRENVDVVGWLRA